VNSENRIDPDRLLKSINDREKKIREAGLRIFLGMSAGVGKTYSMLRAAQQRRLEGVDVVVGVVETHGRSETAALLDGLEIIPRKKNSYRGTIIEEMDIDAILLRKPKLVVVDELAHTNASGSRHQKRYQDVLELLSHGIDVYTALNVQHLESRKDSVEFITGIQIRETVPDSIIERASLVELIDIAPSELLRRLKEGKVYLGDKAVTAAEGFFKEDRLTALREIALRFTAERVDQDLQKFSVTRHDIPWHTNEKLVVAVSHSPYSEKLIRATRRLAYNLEAPWIAVHIETGIHLSDADQAQLTKNMNLARELNAEIITTTDADIASALKRICRQKNITQIVVGRPTRRWFRGMLEGGPLLDRLMKENIEVDVHVIRHDADRIDRPTFIQEVSLYRSRTGWVKYYYTFWFLAFLTGIGAVADPFIGYRAVGFLFLLGVLGVGLFGSIGAVLFSAALSTFAWNFCFIPPKFTFLITQPDDVILCVSYFAAALITGFLTNRIRSHEQLIREREERTNVLYQILKDISESADKNEFIQKTTDRVAALLNGDCHVILKSKAGLLEFSKVLDVTEGWSTDTLGESKAMYIPLKGISEQVGLFVFKPQRKVRKLGSEQESLLFSITSQLGVSIERHFLSRRLHEAQRLKDSEALHQTLLNSISHEMRTPLTAILGSASALQQKTSNDSELRSIANSLNEAGDRLNRVIENLLDMSRLNSGVLALSLEWHDLSDLIGVALKKLAKPLEKNKVLVKVSPKMGLVRIDFRLFEHAVSNVILNASQYAGPNVTIDIECEVVADKIKITIADDGIGIPEESVSKIFEKFYRVPNSPAGGTGLGLSIVKSIIVLHKGVIRFEPNSNRGSRFIIELPYETQPQFPEEAE